MMEDWNDGRLGKIELKDKKPSNQPKFCYLIIPIFHYSIIPAFIIPSFLV